METRELSLDGGFITIRVDVPREPPGPKPAVVTLLGEREAMLAMGLIVVEFRVHWELLAGLAPKTPLPATPPSSGSPAAAPAAAPPKTYGSWLLASPTPKLIGRNYLQLIQANADRTVPRVLDALTAVPEIDWNRVGITGTSTNGFTALQAVAADRRITAAAIIAACGDYHRFLYGSNLAMNGTFLDLAPDYEAWLHAVEPVRHPQRYTHAAILFVNGETDQTIPSACVRETTRVFIAAFAEAGVPERFRSAVLPATGHTFPDEARHRVLAWWYRWLVPPRSDRPE